MLKNLWKVIVSQLKSQRGAIGIYFDGRRLIRPQAATKIDDSGMYARGLGGGNTLALVGECTGGEPGVVQWFTDPSYAKAILRGGALLQAVQRAYDPSSEVSGAYLVAAIRVNPALQAKLNLTDSSYNPLATLTSLDYGAWNNQIKARVETGTGSVGKKLTLTYGTAYDQGDLIEKKSFYLGLADPSATVGTLTITQGTLTKTLATTITATPRTDAIGTIGVYYPDGATPGSAVAPPYALRFPTAPTQYCFIGSDQPFNKVTFTITTPNAETGILSLAAAPTVAGTGYAVGEVLTITTGGTGGTATVLTITGGLATGPVGTVSLTTSGKTYTTGAGKVTSSSGPGINCTLEILTVGSSLSAQYWNGSVWTTVAITDGTKVGTVTLVTSGGSVTFTQPTDWQHSLSTTTPTGPGVDLYWLKLMASGPLTVTAAQSAITIGRGLNNGLGVNLSSYSTIQQLVDYLDAQPHYEAYVSTSSPDTDLSTELDACTADFFGGTLGSTYLTVSYDPAIAGRVLTVNSTTYFGIGDYITVARMDGTAEEMRRITDVNHPIPSTITMDSALSTTYPITTSKVKEALTLGSNVKALIDWINAGNTGYVTAEYPSTTWAASTAYLVGDIVLPSTANDAMYVCIIAGTSNATQPSWPSPVVPGNPVTDSGVTWVTRTATRSAIQNIPDTYLSGGSEGTTSQTNWDTALSTLQSEDVNLLSCVSYDPAVWAALSTHCSYMSTVGKKERIGFCGGFAVADGYVSGLGKWNGSTNINSSITQMETYAGQLNTDRMVYVGPGFKAYDENGDLYTYNGAISAALVAGMAAGVDVAEALTHKTIKVVGLEYNLKWANLDRLLELGVCPLEYEPGFGYRVCQSITTWLQNDKYNRRELSVRRTADYIARQVRERLERDFVGTKGTMTTLISIKNATISVLQQMYRAELLAGDATNPPYKNIQCRLEGDTCWVDFECSPVIPINYIPITIHLTVYTATLTA